MFVWIVMLLLGLLKLRCIFWPLDGSGATKKNATYLALSGVSSVKVLQTWCLFIQVNMKHLWVYFQELLVQKFGSELKNCAQIDSD